MTETDRRLLDEIRAESARGSEWASVVAARLDGVATEIGGLRETVIALTGRVDALYVLSGGTHGTDHQPAAPTVQVSQGAAGSTTGLTGRDIARIVLYVLLAALVVTGHGPAVLRLLSVGWGAP